MLVEHNFDYSFVNFSLNVTKCRMLIDIDEIDTSDDVGCYGNHLAGNCEFLNYQNVYIYKVA